MPVLAGESSDEIFVSDERYGYDKESWVKDSVFIPSDE
jgi:hypothetical protein